MDVENNFRAAVDDTRRWAAIMGTIPLLFLVEEEEGLLEEVVSRSIVNHHNLSLGVDEICFTYGYCCGCKLLN